MAHENNLTLIVNKKKELLVDNNFNKAELGEPCGPKRTGRNNSARFPRHIFVKDCNTLKQNKLVPKQEGT